jgi:hypothetical protein
VIGSAKRLVVLHVLWQITSQMISLWFLIRGLPLFMGFLIVLAQLVRNGAP